MATMPDSFFSWVVFLLNEYGATLLQGAGVTLLLALVGTFIGWGGLCNRSCSRHLPDNS